MSQLTCQTVHICWFTVAMCMLVIEGRVLDVQKFRDHNKKVDILKKMGIFFQQNSLSWNHVGSLCTDSASSS